MKREGDNRGMNRRQLIVLFCVLILSIGLFQKIGSISDENYTILVSGIQDGIETMMNSFVEELVPMKYVVREQNFNMKTSIVTVITKELLPIIQFQWGNDAKETLVVDNQDYLYLMEENEEEHQEEMQLVEKTLEQEKTKETQTKSSDSNASRTSNTTKKYTKAQLYNTSFLMKNFYIVESTARVLPTELNGKALLNEDLTIHTNGKKPKILIYHTHASEMFQDSKEGRLQDGVVGVGSYLTKLLEEQYQIAVYHDTTVYDVIEGKLDRSRAYNMALVGIQKILKDNPSIEVVIDLHRDGIAEGSHLVTTVDGKPTAKLMFMNGISRSSKNGDISYLYNPYKEQNLAFTLQMQRKAEEQYEGLMRKIYIKTYRYNLHVKPRSVLVEVGANTNTIQEAKNAMIPLADLLQQVLKKE